MNFIGKFLNSPELGPNIQSGLLSRIAHAYTASDSAPLSERCHKLANRTLRSCDRTANRPDDPQLNLPLPLPVSAGWRSSRFCSTCRCAVRFWRIVLKKSFFADD